LNHNFYGRDARLPVGKPHLHHGCGTIKPDARRRTHVVHRSSPPRSAGSKSLTRMTRWSGVLRPSSSRTVVYDGRDDLRSGLLVDEVRLVRISSNCRTCGSTSIMRCRAMWWAGLCTYLASSTPAVSVRRRQPTSPAHSEKQPQIHKTPQHLSPI
jgi:hypothetical protein